MSLSRFLLKWSKLSICRDFRGHFFFNLQGFFKSCTCFSQMNFLDFVYFSEIFEWFWKSEGFPSHPFQKHNFSSELTIISIKKWTFHNSLKDPKSYIEKQFGGELEIWTSKFFLSFFRKWLCTYPSEKFTYRNFWKYSEKI